MKQHIAPQAASTDEATPAATDPADHHWLSNLWVTPVMVQQILDANAIADATGEQA